MIGDRRLGIASELRRMVLPQAILVLLLAIVATLAVTTYRSSDRRARSTEDLLVSIGTLRAEVLSAETGLRGYLLVREPSFRAPFDDAFPRIAQDVAYLRRHTSGRVRTEVDEIAATVDDWHERFALVVLADVARGDEQVARSLVVSGAGKRRIDHVRSLADDIESRTRTELAARRTTADRRAFGGLFLAGAIVVALVGTVARGRRRLDAAVAVPLVGLADTADRFGDGDLSVRARASGVSEVRRVASAFNLMAHRTEATVTDLRAIDRIKSELVSVVSHELRTPLTSIRGSLGLLASDAMGALPPDAKAMLDIAVSNTDRLVRLINDLLDLERIASGQDTLDLRPHAVEQLLRAAASGVEGAAADAGVVVEVRPIDAVVDADADRVVQALTNLLGNAIKFSDPGTTVLLRATARDLDVAISVTDSGRGIPAEQLDAIFERFHQVDASDAREKGGTGLGLPIVRSIAERHGGSVEVDSEVGRGSTFTLVLPRVQRGSAASPSMDDDAAVVLLVEDDEDLRRVVSATLERKGLRVASVATADEAIAACRAHRPDVLVLDVALAEGDGYEVVSSLRQDDRLRTLPTLVYTVSDLSEAQRGALRLGRTTFLTKGQRSPEHLDREVLDLLSSPGDVTS